jgi:hypothetical protein
MLRCIKEQTCAIMYNFELLTTITNNLRFRIKTF